MTVPFFDTRVSLRGGGTLLPINPILKSKSTNLKFSVSTDAFNINTAIIGLVKGPICIAAVYKVPWASRTNTEDLINNLDNLAKKMLCIFTGDFNLGLIDWLNPSATPCDSMHNSFQAFVDFNALD